MTPFTFEVKTDCGNSLYFGLFFKEAEEVYNKSKCSVIFFERDSIGNVKRIINNKDRSAKVSIESIIKSKTAG